MQDIDPQWETVMAAQIPPAKLGLLLNDPLNIELLAINASLVYLAFPKEKLDVLTPALNKIGVVATDTMDRSEVEGELSVGMRRMRKYGFKIVRDCESDDEGKQQRDALLAACALLGLNDTQENKSTYFVSSLAQTLLQNATAGAYPKSTSMPDNLKKLLSAIQPQPQRQDSTNDQLRDLIDFANCLGLYDAADSIKLSIGMR